MNNGNADGIAGLRARMLEAMSHDELIEHLIDTEIALGGQIEARKEAEDQRTAPQRKGGDAKADKYIPMKVAACEVYLALHGQCGERPEYKVFLEKLKQMRQNVSQTDAFADNWWEDLVKNEKDGGVNVWWKMMNTVEF